LDGHVWISLGTCSDGSVVIAHSSPGDSRTGQPGGGVQISAVGKSSECEAYKLADKYMSEYYPEWYERYPVMLNDPDVYFDFEDEDAGRFTWNINGSNFSDPENIAEMTPAQVLEFLFADA
ncbi:MAG: copper amine oxidase N-terminal domain-containing protein, partial [Clostridia bacterium]|nr:copper amine oxidase N-terminal domain-containing protein [Clostridia bacterium]